MEVGREVKGGTEALDESDRAAQSAPDPEIPLRSPPLVCKDRPQETTQHRTRDSGAPRARRTGRRAPPPLLPGRGRVRVRRGRRRGGESSRARGVRTG